MNRRGSLKVWLGGLLIAALGAAGVVAWLALKPVNGPTVGKSLVLGRPNEAAPSFERETSAPAPTALAETPAGQPAASPAASAPAAPAEAAPMRHLTVNVVDAQGLSVSGATVTVFRAAPEMDPSQLVGQLKQGTELQPRSRTEAAAVAQRVMRQLRESDATWADPLGHATTDAAGLVDVDAPGEDALLVAEHAPEGSSGVVTIAAAETAGRHLLKLSPRGTLYGRVLTTDGQPAAGASVIFGQAHLPDENAGRPRLPRTILADADGRFTVEVDTSYFGIVRAELDGTSTVDEYAQVSPGETGELELRFPGAFAIDGVVLGPDGAPVAEAAIQPAGYKVHVDPVGTDDRGHFHMSLTRACHVVPIAHKAGLAQVEPIGVTVSDQQPVASIELRMATAATIGGTVLNADGQPLANAMVSALGAKRVGGVPLSDASGMASRDDVYAFIDESEAMEATGADGHFLLDGLLADCTYDLTAYAPSEDHATAELAAVASGRSDIELRFAPKAAGSDVLVGRVIDAQTHSAITSCVVTASDWVFGHTTPFGGSRCRVEDADGRFRIEDLEPDQEYGLLVEVANYPPKTFGPYKPSADTQIELVVGRHGSLNVAVIDAEGHPQRGATVQLCTGLARGFAVIFGEVEGRTADERGLLSWPGLAPGAYSLEAIQGSLRSPRVTANVAAGADLSVQLTVATPPGTGRLEIHVVHIDGSAWVGAAVRAAVITEDEDDTSLLEPIYLGTSDANGLLVFDHLAPASYAIDAQGGKGIVPVEHADVGESATVAVTLQEKKFDH